MPITRLSSQLGYTQVLSGLHLNLGRLLESQEQLATGLRFQRASDDPAGARRVIGLRNRLSVAERAQSVLSSAESVLGQGASRLQEVSGLVTEARELVIQAMNGVLDPDSRSLIGNELAGIREDLLRLANSQVEGSSLFAGSEVGAVPFVEQGGGNGIPRVVYQGDGQSQVLEGWSHDGADLRFVTPAGRYVPAKVRAFRDFLVGELAQLECGQPRAALERSAA